jgi:DNA-directed RNA polymerase subunit M/transcription elongation factor TFIIS
MKQDLLKGLTKEQIAKARSCKNPEEIISLAKSEGVELSEEQLAAVSGGGCFSSEKCPKCGSSNLDGWWDYVPGEGDDVEENHYKCKNCGYEWIRRI